MADDTAVLLQKLGVQRANFFGYSEGGVVAQTIAIRHPHRIGDTTVLPDGRLAVDNTDLVRTAAATIGTTET